MAPLPVLPAYGAGCLSDLVPALMGPTADRPGWLPGAVRDTERTVVLVLDGLGWLQLRDRLALVPAMASMEAATITSVAPTTTATALTSIVAGAPPARHGLVGYRMVVPGPSGDPEVMNALRWRTSSGDARPFVDPAGFVPLEPFGGAPVPVVSRSEFEGSGFSVAHLGAAPLVGWSLPSSIAVLVRRLVAAGAPTVYAYYEGVDKIAHGRGFGEEYDAELLAADRLVADVLDALPPEVTLVVTADHGQVEVGGRVEQLDAGVLAEAALVSGEARFRWFCARPGRADRLRDLVADRYGHQAWVRTIDEVDAEGWFGGTLAAGLRRRLGDVALVPWEPVAYLEPGDGDARLVCRHGSLTAEEVLVPLLAAAGRGHA